MEDQYIITAPNVHNNGRKNKKERKQKDKHGQIRINRERQKKG